MTKMIPCACGCGRLITERNRWGYPHRFVHGHNGRGALHYDYKGGKYINDSGYVMVLRPDHSRASSNGYVREHILVMEAFLGRPLKSEENIHHINGNRQDNRIQNLMRFDTFSEHMAKHHNIPLGPKYCYNCQTIDPKRWHIDREKEKWCCRNCYERKQRLKILLTVA